MRCKLILFAFFAFLAFPGVYSADAAPPPWADGEEVTAPEPEGVSESRLPLVRSRLEGGQQVWVGQAVGVVIEAIVPTWFSGSPEFPQIEVPNAITLSPEGTVNFVIRSGGKSFAAQSRRYLIYPQAKGIYTVQPVTVGVSFAQPGTSPIQAFLASPPLQFEARVPPDAENAKYFLTAEGFQISQSVDGKPEEMEVGGSITRTIEMTARETLGISIPPIISEAPEGIRVYPGAPKIKETAERGTVQAIRTETAVYVAEKEGQYLIPEIDVLWWNPKNGMMNRAVLPSIALQVRADSGSPSEQFASSRTDEMHLKENGDSWEKIVGKALTLAAFFLAGLIVFLIVRRFLAMKAVSIHSRISEVRRRRAREEEARFKEFRKSSLAGDPAASFKHLAFWLDCTNPGPCSPTLREFAEESGIPALPRELMLLKNYLFGRRLDMEGLPPTSKWSGTKLFNLVADARKLRKRAGKRSHRAKPLIDSIN
jgi:hypothetical protein